MRARSVGANALPGFHLALITLLEDLRVKADLHHRVNDVWRERRHVRIDLLLAQSIPMGVQAFAQRGRKADAGDQVSRDPPFDVGVSVMSYCLFAESRSASPSLPYVRAVLRSGNGVWRKVSVALHFEFAVDANFRLRDSKA